MGCWGMCDRWHRERGRTVAGWTDGGLGMKDVECRRHAAVWRFGA